ncbi:hypothetical protein J6590_014620, partial [Homalodisca vitripennis]
YKFNESRIKIQKAVDSQRRSSVPLLLPADGRRHTVECGMGRTTRWIQKRHETRRC